MSVSRSPTWHNGRLWGIFLFCGAAKQRTGAYSSHGVYAAVGRWRIEVWLLPPQPAPDKSILVTLWCGPALLMDVPTANRPPPTPIGAESQARYSGQLANELGVPLSTFTAHLALVRWGCHVHSGVASLKGADTERGRSTQPLLLKRSCLRACSYSRIMYHR